MSATKSHVRAPVIALVDCNSFYCSCERLFRPDLAHRPVGVLSNNDGCFVSLSPELRVLGVKMGEPYFKVRDLCRQKNVAVFSANFSLYTQMSDRVMRTLSKFTQNMQVYSVDEAFLDLSDVPLSQLYSLAAQIRETVFFETGLPVSVGVAPTKTLAKVANYHTKKLRLASGVHVILNQAEQSQLLENFLVEDIWGIGRKSAEKLYRLGIRSALRFRDFKNTQQLQRALGITGLQIQKELLGENCFLLNSDLEQKKGITSSRSFGSPVKTLEGMRDAVTAFASQVSEKLREQNSVCSVVSVSIRTNPHSKDQSSYYTASDYQRFLSHTADTRKIIGAALEILDKIYHAGHAYAKAHVGLSGIRGPEQTQLSFFEKPDTPKDEKLMKTMDLINAHAGNRVARIGAVAGESENEWKSRRDWASPKYLSGWKELPRVR
jgi:DNA polymerase V